VWYLLQFAIVVAVALSDLQWNWAGHNNMILGVAAGVAAWLVTAALSWLIGCRLEEK
jgi:hypothetical protein